jgi:pimeloyl-ACP methyl ester carboxylesterase
MEVDVGGLTVAYERAGTGPPVVLLHGFVGDGRSTWGRQIDALADEFTVVAWDAPGAGSSSDPPDDFGVDGYADCLAELLSAVGLQRVSLVGVSCGCAVALATFHRHRALVSSLALVGGYAGWVGSLGRAEAEERLTRSLELSELPPDEFATAMAPSMFSPTAEGRGVTRFVESVKDSRPTGFRAQARACFDDQSHVLPEVDVPTLLLYSDHDVRAPIAVGEALHAAIARSELVVLRGPGHASPVESPDEVTRELRRFLRAHPQESTPD